MRRYGIYTKGITVRFTDEEYKRLKIFVVQNDTNMSDYIRDLIKADMERNEAEERKANEE